MEHINLVAMYRRFPISVRWRFELICGSRQRGAMGGTQEALGTFA